MSPICKTPCVDVNPPKKHSIRPPHILCVLSSCSSALLRNTAVLQEPIPAGFALVTQTCAHTHPRIWKNLFSWRESHLLCKPRNIVSPRKLFVFQYLKRHKGKHRQFICLLYWLQVPFKPHDGFFFVSQREMTHKKCFFHSLLCVWLCCQEHARTRVICKMLCGPQLGQNGSPSADPQSKGQLAFPPKFLAAYYTTTHTDRERAWCLTERAREGGMGAFVPEFTHD